MNTAIRQMATCAVLLAASALTNVASGTAAERIYVGNTTNGVNGSVSIVDGTSNAIVGTIPVGDYPYGAAANPAGTRVYVANANSDSVSVIDTATNTILETIPVSPGPVFLLVSPDGGRLYVSNQTDQSVSVLDTTNYSVVAQIGIAGQAFAIALNPSGSRLYVCSEPYVHVIDTATNTEIAQINVGPQPTGVAYSASTNKLYVTNGNANFVTVVDALSNTVLSTFNWPGRPYGIASSPAGDRVWFTSLYANQLAVIDTSTDTVVNSLDLCNGPLLVALNATGTRVYVTCAFDSTLAVIDAGSQQVVASIPGFDNPRPLAVTTVPPPCSTATSISSNFNGTPIRAGDSLWFNSNLTVSGLGSSPVTIRFTGQSVISSGFSVPLPDSSVTFDPAATTASTTFTNGAWTTRVPSSGLAGNVFLSGGSYPVPPGGLPGGINPVTWRGVVSSDTPSASVKWKWGAAVYVALGSDPSQLGVKPVDDKKASQYQNSDHAGTPENFKGLVTGGARGGGGSNYTGSWSGTASVPACTH